MLVLVVLTVVTIDEINFLLLQVIILKYREQWIIRTPYDACLTVKLLMTLL